MDSTTETIIVQIGVETIPLIVYKNVIKKFNHFNTSKTFTFHVLNDQFYLNFFKLFNDVNNRLFDSSPPTFNYSNYKTSQEYKDENDHKPQIEFLFSELII